MPKTFPKEFREDVIGVYKDSDSSVAQGAKDFGISPSWLKRWLTVDERRSYAIDDGKAALLERTTSLVRRVALP